MVYPGNTQSTDYPAAPMPTEEEQLRKLLGLSGLTDQEDLLREQLAQAEALRNPSGQNYSTGLGAGLGGVGDIARNIGGAIKGKMLRDKLEGLQGQMAEGRQGLGNSIASLFRGMQPKPPVTADDFPDVSPPQSLISAKRAGLPGASPFGAF